MTNPIDELRREMTLSRHDERPLTLNLPSADSLRMTFKHKKRNSGPALTLNNTNLISFGEIFAVIGLPGQGKSAICECITATALGRPNFGFQYNGDGRKVLMIDTERTPDDVSESYRNILKRMGTNPPLDADGEIDNLRYLAFSEVGKVTDLKTLFEREVSTGDYGIVILDGILDLAMSMNDDQDATALIKWVRALAVKYNVAIVVTMHPNKGAETMAGHLGAFLYRWARAILFIRTSKHDRHIKEITGEPEQAKLSHGSLAEFEPIYFCWDADLAMLVPCNYTPPDDRGKADKIANVLTNILQNDRRLRHGELVKEVTAMGHSEKTAKRWIKDAKESGLISNSNAIYKLEKGQGQQ